MLSNLLWNLFENTGNVDIYLKYKDYQNEQIKYKQHIYGDYNEKKVVNK